MRVLIIYNQFVLADPHAEADWEHEIFGTVEAVHIIQAREGFEISRLAVGRDWPLLSRELLRRRPDVVFNLFEGLADQPTSEPGVAAIVEQLGIPITGCPSQTLALALHKPETKRVLLAAGL